ncbi:MAG: hypothetical protein Q8L10_04705 [Candidatus Moranbacteria bacterium]|nr:hypothetical protein [Candidatus Moranbacteria bacterium]
MNTQIQSDLIKELGLENLPSDKQEELIIKMTEVVLKRMFIETMDRLSPIDQELFGGMLENQAGPDEIENFLKENIHNYEELLQKIISELKAEMKSA